jgi:hypothetical protein
MEISGQFQAAEWKGGDAYPFPDITEILDQLKSKNILVV